MRHIALFAPLFVILIGCGSNASQTNEVSPMEDIDLADVIFDRILKEHGEDLDPSKISKPQQTVMLVYHSYGIIGNGGFQYLFEGDFPGDPEFLLTRQAYKTIGAEDASAAFTKAFSVFPKSTPPENIDRRLEIWQSNYNLMDSAKDVASPDSMYFNAMDGVMEKLNRYIKSNEADFAALPE